MGVKEALIQQGYEIGFEIGFEQGIKKSIEQRIEKGLEKWKEQVIKNLLAADKCTIAEIANFANSTEANVRRVKKSLKNK